MGITYGFTPGGANLTTDLPEIESFMAGFQRKQPDSSRGGARGGVGGYGGYPVRQEQHDRLDLAAETPGAYLRPMVGGPGIVVGGQTTKLDMNKLGARERRMYLPQNVQMGGIGESRASLSPAPQQQMAPDATDAWYSLPDHIRKLKLIQAGYGNNVPVQEGK